MPEEQLLKSKIKNITHNLSFFRYENSRMIYDRGMWVLLLAFIAPFTPSMDLYISGFFYSPVEGFYNNSFFQFMFHYGELFGLGSGCAAALFFLLSYVRPKWKKFRRGSLAMVLTLVIGAGLITNVALKGHWGRPRPKQIIEFGGKHVYLPFWKPNFHTKHDPQKSFPSGHVAMGFYFLSFCLVGKRYRNRFLYGSGFVLTVFLGGGLMITRVVQGGHFLSDVIVSPILMWYTARLVDTVLFTWGGPEKLAPCSEQNDTFPKPDEISRA